MSTIFISMTVLFLTQDISSAIRGDLVKLQGEWITRFGPNDERSATWDISGNKLTSRTTTDEGERVVSKGTLKLDEESDPKLLDLTQVSTDFEGHGVSEDDDWRAIYEIRGEELRICMAPVGAPRPKKFSSGEASDVIIFRRVKK